VTAEFKINFLAPAKGEEIVARAKIERAGRSLIVVSAAIFARHGASETKCAAALVTLTPVPFG
jgi:acyl-coenzyme A thioesterase PaaI-like protein